MSNIGGVDRLDKLTASKLTTSGGAVNGLVNGLTGWNG